MIDAKARDLAWRLFVSEKIIHNDPDKIWKTADRNIIKAFKNYPPTAAAIEEKKAEWAKIDAGKRPAQP
jgi:type IV secretory pathway VirD2 relaxase